MADPPDVTPRKRDDLSEPGVLFGLSVTLMSPAWIALAALGVAAAGPAGAAQTPHLPVYVVMGRHALFGRSMPSAVDDSGVIDLQATDDSKLICHVSYSYSQGGDAGFDCTDGTRFHMSYQGSGPDTGSGRKTVYGMVVSICYGLSPKAAIRHLAAPAGYVLTVEGDHLILTPR